MSVLRDVLLWIPTHGRAKAGRPARTYIQQLCEDTGCCPEDLPRAMNDREEWRERVRDIRAASTIWWWWWLFYMSFRLYIKSHIQSEYISNVNGRKLNHCYSAIVNLFRRNHFNFPISVSASIQDLTQRSNDPKVRL